MFFKTRAELLLLLFLLFSTLMQAQVKIGTNATSIDPRSILELETTDKAILLPRLTTIQRNAQTDWKAGMFIYNSTESVIQYYNGLAWKTLFNGAVAVLPVQQGGTGTGTEFTTGSVVFSGAGGVYSQNNANLFWDNANNRFGVGTATPKSTMDVRGSVSSAIITVDASITLDETHSTIIFQPSTPSGTTITLPDPATCPGRKYTIINRACNGELSITPVKSFIYTCQDFDTQLISRKSYVIQSDGTDWYMLSVSEYFF